MDAVSGAARHHEIRALLCLDALPDVGPRTLLRLVERFGSGRAAWSARPADFAAVAGRAAAAARRDPQVERRVDDGLRRARRDAMEILIWTDGSYPAGLRRLADPPPVLFLRGARPGLLSAPAVTVVGARRATTRGREVARRLGAAIACAGRGAVSGLALGVDAAAHRGALAGGGGTVAVLARGADDAYPRVHRRLFGRILEEGLVVSEFLPGTPPLRHHFPRRNRILAALSHTVVVVEAGARSGALITVDHALDLGLDVYAVPGPIDVPSCAGSNALLADGAPPLVSVESFVRERLNGGQLSRHVPAGDGVGELERRLLRSLEAMDGAGGGSAVDELAQRAGAPVSRVLAALARMELTGYVERAAGGRYRRRA